MKQQLHEDESTAVPPQLPQRGLSQARHRDQCAVYSLGATLTDANPSLPTRANILFQSETHEM